MYCTLKRRQDHITACAPLVLSQQVYTDPKFTHCVTVSAKSFLLEQAPNIPLEDEEQARVFTFEKERIRQGETEQEGRRDEDHRGGLDKGKRDGFKNRIDRQPEDEALRLVPQNPETGKSRSWYVLATGGVRSSDSAGRSTSEGEKLESGHDSDARKEVEGW